MVMNLLLIVFLIVSGIIVLNTAIIDIKNSTKVYGILKAVGFSNSFIVRVILIKALMIMNIPEQNPSAVRQREINIRFYGNRNSG